MNEYTKLALWCILAGVIVVLLSPILIPLGIFVWLFDAVRGTHRQGDPDDGSDEHGYGL